MDDAVAVANLKKAKAQRLKMQKESLPKTAQREALASKSAPTGKFQHVSNFKAQPSEPLETMTDEAELAQAVMNVSVAAANLKKAKKKVYEKAARKTIH
jgi:hypothetical protein